MKSQCSICHRVITDNVNPGKVITCARCVQSLLMATQENKIAFRNGLLAKGDTEGARSIESFIVPEEDRDVATFKTPCLLKQSNRLVHRIKRSLKDISDLNRNG